MKTNFVVAIGSAAGGLAPMLSFFDYTTHDEVTYIILRHIPLDHRSQLHNILERHSKLRIVEADNNTLIKNDTIYIPPARMYMTIKNDRLYLQQRVKKPLFPNSSLDIFFNSLADDKGKNSIAVILSGYGSDGAKGAISINLAGGMVIVQTPATCEYDLMPLNVIKTGIVDSILNPAEMPSFIRQYTETILKNTNEI